MVAFCAILVHTTISKCFKDLLMYEGDNVNKLLHNLQKLIYELNGSFYTLKWKIKPIECQHQDRLHAFYYIFNE